MVKDAVKKKRRKRRWRTRPVDLQLQERRVAGWSPIRTARCTGNCLILQFSSPEQEERRGSACGGRLIGPEDC